MEVTQLYRKDLKKARTNKFLPFLIKQLNLNKRECNNNHGRSKKRRYPIK